MPSAPVPRAHPCPRQACLSVVGIALLFPSLTIPLSPPGRAPSHTADFGAGFGGPGEGGELMKPKEIPIDFFNSACAPRLTACRPASPCVRIDPTSADIRPEHATTHTHATKHFGREHALTFRTLCPPTAPGRTLRWPDVADFVDDYDDEDLA
eukprot:COSAG01_NODE_50_length_31487_cov_90.470243_27_plen_153_part_00